MVDISQDGRLVDGTQVVEPATARVVHGMRTEVSDDAMHPITPERAALTGLDRRMRFDLPLASFGQLKTVSEVLDTLARGLEGLSYMRHKNEAHVLREARDLVARAKRRLLNV